MMRLQRAVGPLFLAWAAHAEPACVLTPSGTMLCCDDTDYDCLAKLKAAHPDPEKSLANIFTHQSFGGPPKPGMVGSMYTFANASVWTQNALFDVAVIGIPFSLVDDNWQAPGMQLIRKETSFIPAYSRLYGSSIKDYTIVDGQDLVVSGGMMERFKSLETAVTPIFQTGKPVIALGGDGTITVPMMHAASKSVGKFAVIHIDKDLAVGKGDSREQPLHDSTAMFWSSASKLFDVRHSSHIGSLGNLPSEKVELLDQELGFQTILAEDFQMSGVNGIVQLVKERLGRRDGTFMPAYISIDVDVLDIFGGGISVRELRVLLAGLRPFCVVRAADIRGIAHITDPALVKQVAAIAHDLALLTARRSGKGIVPLTPV